MLLETCFLVILAITSDAATTGTASSVAPKVTPVIYWWRLAEYPNPLTDPQKCRQLKPSLLCDPDQILPPHESDHLGQQLHQLSEKSNRCFCEKCPPGHAGIKLAIALATSIQPQDSKSSVQTFADQLHQRWRFGLCNDSILILVIKQWSGRNSLLVTSFTPLSRRIVHEEMIRTVVSRYNSTGDYNLLRSIVAIIGQEVESLPEDTSSYRDVPIMAAGVEAGVAVPDPRDDSNRFSLIVVVAMMGLIVFVMFFVAGYILIKRDQQHAASTGIDLSSNEYHSLPAESRQPPISVPEDDDDDENDYGGILGDESRISTPKSSISNS